MNRYEMYGMTQNKTVQPNGRQEGKKYMARIQKQKLERKKRMETSFIDLQYGNYVRRRRAQVYGNCDVAIAINNQ
jgi:hypothetical protein